MIVQETLIQLIWKMGAQIFSCVPSEAENLVDDKDDPTRTLIRQVLGAVAQYDRANIALRLRKAREHKANAGGYAGYGAPAYGQQSVNKALEPVDTEQDGWPSCVPSTLPELRYARSLTHCTRPDISPSAGSAGTQPRQGCGKITVRIDQTTLPVWSGLEKYFELIRKPSNHRRFTSLPAYPCRPNPTTLSCHTLPRAISPQPCNHGEPLPVTHGRLNR